MPPEFQTGRVRYIPVVYCAHVQVPISCSTSYRSFFFFFLRVTFNRLLKRRRSCVRSRQVGSVGATITDIMVYVARAMEMPTNLTGRETGLPFSASGGRCMQIHHLLNTLTRLDPLPSKGTVWNSHSHFEWHNIRNKIFFLFFCLNFILFNIFCIVPLSHN